ncbi:MAG TPA: ABC transporter substrate-binding protein [Burkholderiaceae bacterium]|nr:ABC transporter substrate-binding protein [Burkholderiaceae bacterium]
MPLTRRDLLIGAAAPLWLPGSADAAAEPKKVLRYAFEVAETGLDPVKLSDLYSRTLSPHIFEAMYAYDHLARPVKYRPLTADGMPQVSDDFRVWTIKIRPGIYFADDPAFKGKKRELVAQDYVYSFKRFADPANVSPQWSGVENDAYLGLNELHKEALDGKKPFDYDREIEGVRALDRYTLRFTVTRPRPRLMETFSASDLFGAVAREVVEFYGDKIDEHPVGTGPFKLIEWRRSSFLAFERNPDFREMLYDAEPAADDAEGQAILAKLKGRRLPMIDRVEISIIEEEQPRWLSFINGEADFAYRVGYQFVNQAMPNGKVAPNLAKKGIRGYHIVESATSVYVFNMEDPTIGGYAPAKVALRRAIGLGLDVPLQISYAYSGLGAVAQSAVAPFTDARDPKFRSEYGEYNPARAQALLDLYGYKDRDGDGWREMPDGSPLVLRNSTQADLRSRRLAEVFDRNMRALGLRVETLVAQWPENLKSVRAGRLQIWSLSLSSAGPDAIGAYQLYDSHEIGGQNFARFKMPAVDALYQRLQPLPNGPERIGLFREIEALCLAYMPYKYTIERLSLDMAYSQLVGYRRPVFWQEWWHYVDIDNSLRVAAR